MSRWNIFISVFMDVFLMAVLILCFIGLVKTF